jgi:hypothetical protein
MKNFIELKKAIRNNKKLVFKDKNKYFKIDYIEEITNDFDVLTPILITYNKGNSEAEIFLNEIYLITDKN